MLWVDRCDGGSREVLNRARLEWPQVREKTPESVRYFQEST
jgi:hypothetical protein